jgi:hypothetical protein
MTLVSKNTDEVSAMEILNTVISNGYYCYASETKPATYLV